MRSFDKAPCRASPLVELHVKLLAGLLIELYIEFPAGLLA